MIFQLLRRFLKDSEFEQTKLELAEARSVLSEYREIMQDQTRKAIQESDKPDIEFITLLWASIGFATAIGGNSLEKIPSDVKLIRTPQEVIWLIIALTMMMFVILNTIFAVDLTRKYASYRRDQRYRIYSQELSAAIIVYIIGAALLFFFNGPP